MALIGFVSGLLSPWVTWRVDKKREQQAYRRALIETWRAALEAEEYDFIDARSTFGNSAAYSSLRSHLSRQVLNKVGSSWNRVGKSRA